MTPPYPLRTKGTTRLTGRVRFARRRRWFRPDDLVAQVEIRNDFHQNDFTSKGNVPVTRLSWKNVEIEDLSTLRFSVTDGADFDVGLEARKA
jgi:hypothetical protein